MRGLFFISRAWFDGAWAHDEYTSLVLRKGEDGIRLVPVLIEEVGSRLPTRLRKLARRSVEDYEAIRNTLLGVDHRPGVTTAWDALTRSLSIQLEDTGAGRATVTLLIDEQARASEADVRVPGGLCRGSVGPATFAGLRQRMNSVVFAGAVGQVDQRALVAVGRSILVIVWHLLSDPEARFHDLGPDFYDNRIGPERKKRNHIHQLEALGYKVTLHPAA